MKHGGYSTKKIGGFTLIEILIVMIIISIATSVVLLSIHHNDNRRLTTFTNELVETLSLAEEQAMLQPATLGLALDSHTFHFFSYQQVESPERKVIAWQPLQDKLLGNHVIPEDFELKLILATASDEDKEDDEKDDNLTPQVIISTNGDITPFTLYIGKKGQRPRYAIMGDADGNITSKLLS